MGRGAEQGEDGGHDAGVKEEDDWDDLLLPENFGEGILQSAAANTNEAVPTNLGETLPLDAEGQRPYWLATVNANRISMTQAWEAIGRPSSMVFGPRHGTNTVVAGGGTTPPPEGWPAVRVNIDRGMARCPLPRQALDTLGLVNGDVLLIVKQGRALFLANPERFGELSPRPGEQW